MDANQLIKSLGEAAAAAKPPQEYCLMWIDHWSMCMTKSEWASWIQAFGAISAILGAAWIAARQERNARRQSKQLAVRKTRSALAGLVAAAELVREKGSYWLADAGAKRLLAEEHLQVARSIDAEQLHLSWTVHVYGLRSLGVQLVSALTRFEQSRSRQGHPGLGEAAAHDELVKAAAEIEAHLLKIQEFVSHSHPGVDAYRD